MNKQKIKKGIYSIEFSNKKRYIGMSNNIQNRIKEHKLDAKNNDLLPVHCAMRKYNYKIKILEDCQNFSRSEMADKEKYWIKYYDTFNNKEKGYNLTPGGDGAAVGIYNAAAKLNEQTLSEVYNLLINHLELYIYEIASKYNISSEAISEINVGKRYYNEFLQYPLRQPPKPKGPGHGINNHSAKFTSNQSLNEVYMDLENNILSLEEIAKKYKVSYTTISKINRGITYTQKDYSYPIRKNKKKTLTDYDSIIQLLLTTKLSFTDIGKKFNLSVSTIGRINNGKIHHMDNLNYPIRQ